MPAQQGEQQTSPPRHTFILRLWRADPAAPWQASLLNTVTEEQLGFGQVDQLLHHLAALTAPAKGEKTMILVRDEVKCKMGEANAFVERFKAAAPMLEGQDVIKSARVLTDLSGSFDTVIAEYEVESLDAYFAFMKAAFAQMAEREGADEFAYQSGARTFYTIEAVLP